MTVYHLSQTIYLKDTESWPDDKTHYKKNHFSGITRIKQLYAESLIKPDFEVSENAIKIVLPVFEANVHLIEDEKVIYKFLSKTMLKPISDIAPYVPFGKLKTTHLLKTMEEKGVVAVEGKGRETKYIIKWVGGTAIFLVGGINSYDWALVSQLQVWRSLPDTIQ